ncbi:MAG: hypothetical protein ACRC0C_16975 [Gibbsiella quercinecans]|uniref:hypothetical protein n=1 Tax=Gibbsiella quercinecans TaxID=929813 RepID=UPI003F2B8412
MAKHALNLAVKIALFTLVMLLVAKFVPYNGFVDNFIIKHVSFDDAENIGKLILGEPDPEPYESARDDINILINTLLSVPLLSAVITAFNKISRKVKPADILKEWAVSTLRRFAKLFTFTLLFCALLRFLPYQTIFPDNQTYSSLTMAATVCFHLLVTAICYWFITKNITIKRNL